MKLLTEMDLHLFNEGRHFSIHRKLGAHPALGENGPSGVHFSVWAPNAENVSVIGSFNGWDPGSNVLQPQEVSGIWSGFIEEASRGDLYKFSIQPNGGGPPLEKADPVAFYAEVPPRTASVVWGLEYEWHDRNWMARRSERNGFRNPVSIYELHLGSWRRKSGGWPSYRDIAEDLPRYLKELGFTHVELMPVMEHPFYGSWGYQVTGFFSPSSRYGTPQDFMYLIDRLHQEEIGVVLDWVPSHFPSDAHGLAMFDGTHLYEHADPKQGFHPDWNSLIFNYGRNEVRSFLISSALFWLEKYHVDGLRVDAVASMLYLDYSRREGEWVPNIHGGRENIEAISFMRQLNEAVHSHHPDVQTFAEESTAWPGVSRPTSMGGLGFGYKWDMGWMHDTLKYFSKEPIHRKYHQGDLTFRAIYAFHENFVLSLSHDEVVYGKGSLVSKMPGDEWQKFANLRCLYAYQFSQPGKKLIFMGSEFGQWKEWDHESALQWELVDRPLHAGLVREIRDLNRIYRVERALHSTDSDGSGFEWLDAADAQHSVLSYLRRAHSGGDTILAVFNMTPVPRFNYRLGAPESGDWKEIFNSDARDYGGSGHGNLGSIATAPIEFHGRRYSLNLTLPPFGAIYLKWGPS